MRRILILLLIAILGVMPLAGMTSQAGSGAQEMQGDQGMQDMPCHQGAPQQEAVPDGHCDSCKSAGLCCIAFMPPATVSGTCGQASAGRIDSDPDVISGIVITPLDPPPLAL